MDDLAKLLIEWIGIDPVTETFGGWGYRSVAEFFIQHTTLTTKETFQAGGTVKNRFEYYFSIINSEEKEKIIREVLNTFPIDATYPQRTVSLMNQLNQSANEFLKTWHGKLIEGYMAILGLSTLDTLDKLGKAYRTQISKYHPDKVASLADEFKILAETKSKEINEAYSFLKSILDSAK